MELCREDVSEWWTQEMRGSGSSSSRIHQSAWFLLLCRQGLLSRPQEHHAKTCCRLCLPSFVKQSVAPRGRWTG